MKGKKPKRRYYTANQIRDDIDKWKAKAQKLKDAGHALDKKAEMLFATGENNTLGEFTRDQADRKRASAARIEERKLVRLKEKLSEFMTDPLVGTGVTKDIST